MIIIANLLCSRCEASLRTLPTNARCPGCGMPVSNSLTPDRLLLQPASALRKLPPPVAFFAIALSLGLLQGIADWLLARYGHKLYPGLADALAESSYARWTPFIHAAVTFIAAWWVTATPAAARRAKTLVRLPASVWFLLALAVFFFEPDPSEIRYDEEATALWTHIYTVVQSTAQLTLLAFTLYLGRMLRRAQYPNLGTQFILAGTCRFALYMLDLALYNAITFMDKDFTLALLYRGKTSCLPYIMAPLELYLITLLFLAWRAFLLTTRHRQSLTAPNQPLIAPAPTEPTTTPMTP